MLVTTILLGTGRWFFGLTCLACLAYTINLFIKKQVYVAATDAFTQLKPQKKRRTVLFGFHCLAFVFVTYRCGVHSLYFWGGGFCCPAPFFRAGRLPHET